MRGFDRAAVFGDEHHTLLPPRSGYGAVLSSFDDYGTHAVLPLLQLLGRDLFWEAFWTLRLPVVVAGCALLMLAYVVGRRAVGRWAAVLATAALALLGVWQLANAAGYFKERFTTPG